MAVAQMQIGVVAQQRQDPDLFKEITLNDKDLLHVSEEIFDFVFVDNHLLVGVFARDRVFHGFHHFHMVFAGACVGSTLSNAGVFGNFLSHNP